MEADNNPCAGCRKSAYCSKTCKAKKHYDDFLLSQIFLDVLGKKLSSKNKN